MHAHAVRSPEAPYERNAQLIERVRNAIRRRHYSLRTEYTYLQWIKRFIHFIRGHNPADVGRETVTEFLNCLATERHVSAATQNQALAALLFLFKEACARRSPGWMSSSARSGRCGCQWY